MAANDSAIMAVLDGTSIEGLDIADALSRLNNSPSIFMRIIHSFTTNMPANLEELAAPTAESLPDYAIKVHGAKGSLYGIGAKAAGDAAKALEMASKAGDLNTVLADNDAFIAQVQSLIARLEGLEATVRSATSSGAGATAASDAAPDRAKLQALLSATQEYDMDAMAALIEELAAKSYAQGGEDIAYIKECYDAFAYDKIEQRLAAIL